MTPRERHNAVILARMYLESPDEEEARRKLASFPLSVIVEAYDRACDDGEEEP